MADDRHLEIGHLCESFGVLCSETIKIKDQWLTASKLSPESWIKRKSLLCAYLCASRDSTGLLGRRNGRVLDRVCCDL